MKQEKLHITPHNYQINQTDRNIHKNHKSLVVWFTGLSGSGKSTVANHLEKLLIAQNIHTYILDGDNVRAGLNKGLVFTDEDRQENLRRVAEVARLFMDAGVLTLCAFITPLEKDRTLIKDIIGKDNIVEVYIATSLEECERRDIKGLYKKARAGEISHFTGISSPYEVPKNPDLIIDTKTDNPNVIAAEILNYLLTQKKLKQL